MNGHAQFNGVRSCAASYADDECAVRGIRKLVIDICRQNNGGHGGSAIGMAPLAVALWRHVMRYNPNNHAWFDRDRFVLSNGHAAMLLYAMLHLTGYPHMTIDELKMYGNPKSVDPLTGKWKATECHGHPEIETPGVEVTTGPLGQGIANAVGLAIASKQTAATFNKEDLEVISSRIYCVTGDGCLQEGVAQEAMTIAGHLKLDNLVVCYDNNAVTCDGPLDWIVSEDTNARMRALGWQVIDVHNGDRSVDDIVSALNLAKSTSNQPTFINIRTTIGFGTSTAGTFKSHHGTYTDTDAALYVTDPDAIPHDVPARCKDYLGRAVAEGSAREQEWLEKMEKYRQKHPKDAARLSSRMSRQLDVKELLSHVELPADGMATRQSSGQLFKKIIANERFMFGGADLVNSNQLGDLPAETFDASNHGGKVIRYGIREHAMASISNGLAAFHPGFFIPVTATFFMFYLYAAAGVRMGALSRLKAIHIATHDSIGEGQNGPTHQPVELDSLFRAMPNLLYIRPSDAEEVIGAWQCALSAKDGPAMISLARDPVDTAIPDTSRDKVSKGGYAIIESNEKALVTLVSCGSELQFAVKAAEDLTANGIPTRVVSMPCIQLFEEQSREYQRAVWADTPHVISVEAYVSTIWARFCTASVAMDSFGYSGSGAANFSRFGIDSVGVVRKVRQHIDACQKEKPMRWTLL